MFIVSRTQWGTSASYILLDVTEEFLRRSFLHLDVSEELLACIFQTGPKEIDDVIDNQKAIVIMLAVIHGDWRILLVMTLNVELQLSHILRQLACIDSRRYICIALAEQGEGGLVDVVVDEDDGLPGLFDEVGYLHVGIEDLSIVEDALYRWQR